VTGPPPTGAGRLDRLSPQDVSNLRVEARGLPMHVAALAILEGEPLRGPDGPVRLDDLRARIEPRLHLAPRLRQVLFQPPVGLGPPVWVDDAGFDIGRHVRSRAIAPPGDEAALLAACAELHERPLDRSRPLWELWLLTGLASGNVGMLLRLHHVLADGSAAAALFAPMFDPAPHALSPAAPSWTPAPAPSSWALLSDSFRRHAAALGTVGSRLGRPAQAWRRLRSQAAQIRGLLRDGLAPRSSLNHTLGRRRRVLLARADLQRARQVAHANGAKLNDVVLAAVAGGARDLLDSRGELTPGLRLRAMVPVSMRGSGDAGAAGNRVGTMIVSLPIAEPDPVRRLEEIARTTAERKRRPPDQPGARCAQRAVARTMAQQRLVNLFTSNLPGPATPLYVAGSRVLEAFQIGVLQGNITLAVGVLSYAGQLNFAIVGDADACPDLAVFAEGLSGSLRELGIAAQAPSPPRLRSGGTGRRRPVCTN
jgi:diacylglycerol O-acyltransferase